MDATDAEGFMDITDAIDAIDEALSVDVPIPVEFHAVPLQEALPQPQEDVMRKALVNTYWIMGDQGSVRANCKTGWCGQLWFQSGGYVRSTWDLRGQWDVTTNDDGVGALTMMFGGHHYRVSFDSGNDPMWPSQSTTFEAESEAGSSHCGAFVWSKKKHSEEGLEASAAFAWLPGTLWQWSGAEVDLVRVLPDGLLQTPRDSCAHWHQREGHGTLALYVQGQEYHAQFSEVRTTTANGGVAAQSFVAVPQGGDSDVVIVEAARCLPPPEQGHYITHGWLMKRSGRVLTEWRARWVELDARYPILTLTLT